MGRVTPERLAQWQDPATWEDIEDPVLPAVKSPRATFSVSFSRDDFLAVAEYAERHGLKTSEFIRRAALERVAPDGRKTDVSVTGNEQPGDADIDSPRSSTKAQAARGNVA